MLRIFLEVQNGSKISCNFVRRLTDFQPFTQESEQKPARIAANE